MGVEFCFLVPVLNCLVACQAPSLPLGKSPRNSLDRVWVVDCVWNVMAQAQKPDFVFRRNGRVHLNWRGRQFSRLLAAEVCASAVVMLDTTCSEVVWRVLATHSIRHFPLHFPSRASLCAITFQLDYTQGQFWCSRVDNKILSLPKIEPRVTVWQACIITILLFLYRVIEKDGRDFKPL